MLMRRSPHAAWLRAQICAIMQKVVTKEKCGPLPDELAMRIAQYSERNVRRALLMLEACRVQQSSFSSSQEVRRQQASHQSRAGLAPAYCLSWLSIPEAQRPA
jgi:hypothetical protein